jgi:hypothetical protein
MAESVVVAELERVHSHLEDPATAARCPASLLSRLLPPARCEMFKSGQTNPYDEIVSESFYRTISTYHSLIDACDSQDDRRESHQRKLGTHSQSLR